MAEKKKSTSTTSKVSQVLTQARESLKLLETLEKETLAKARTFVRNPIGVSRKNATNAKILSSLRSLGVATQAEVEALERRVETLQAEIVAIQASLKQGSKRTAGEKAASRPAPAPEAFPNT